MHENKINILKLRTFLLIYFVFTANAKREKKILSMTKNVIGRTDWDRRCVSVLAPNAYYHHVDEILRPPFYEGVWSQRGFRTPLQIVTVSSIGPYKGFESIIMVSKILSEQIGLNFTWKVIGLAPNDSVVMIVHKWLGVQTNVRLLGTQSANFIRDTLLDSDIYCQVSHIENSPNSLCEAMLLGMPIVASYAGGTSSLLSSGEEGILVQDGDSLSMAGAILELTKDFVRATKLGKAARIRALARHDSDKIMDNILATYSLIIEKSNAQQRL